MRATGVYVQNEDGFEHRGSGRRRLDRVVALGGVQERVPPRELLNCHKVREAIATVTRQLIIF